MWNAWKEIVDDGISPIDAAKKYIELVDQLKEKYGYNA
jgi:diazepam-binding inhibitor (GABA receptor modulator, acyl-CoA-binding protein)